MGWPPLKKRRKSLFMQKRVGRGAVIRRRPAVENGGGFYRGLNSNNSRYVKVKMEGVGIARKVDLSQYHSFDALRATLMNMFGELVFSPNHKSFFLKKRKKKIGSKQFDHRNKLN